MSHTVELKQDDRLGRGERYIVVDGIIWGQTVVTYHGVHGTKYKFRQIHGNIITEIAPNNAGRLREFEIEVRSGSKKRRFNKNDDQRSTEDRVLDKARELVATDKLRHPDIIKEENRQAAERYRASVEAADAKHTEAFRDKAMEIMNINDRDSEVVSRVVEAMKWAQSQ